MNSRIVFTLFLLCALVVASCKKHNDNVFLANEATIGFDGYSYTDTFKLLTSTIREDSIKTDSLSHNLAGVINESIFGSSRASSFFQFRFQVPNNVISTQKLDSVVLFLQFTSPTAYYGDLNSDMAFDIVELNEAMSGARSHSNQSYSYDALPIGSFSGKLKPADSITIREGTKNVRIAPTIRIKLSSAFATKLFSAGAGNLDAQENFLNYFKGLGIVPTSNPSFGSGVIAAFNMLGTFAKLRIYYNDSMQSDFRVQNESRRFTKYDISNQGTEITSQKSAASNASFDVTYAQAMAGAKTRIKIPHLFSIINKNTNKKISVGKAEIIIRPLAGTFASPFTPPTRMLILQPHPTTNLNAGILDLFEVFYGGSYNATKNEYRFNITRHIQSLFSDYQLLGKDNNKGLFLAIPSDFPIAPSRVILDMRKGIPNAGIEFKLIYTEL